ncbi:MAG: acyltransferase [Deltaproteobacteria bacterium]|nr:MAG: acyltransferase [Deltaproteobacteria bacterium]
MPRNNRTRTAIILAAVFLPLTLAAGCTGCEDTESDDPIPISTTSAEPSASVDLKPDEELDAGVDGETDADADAGKPRGKGGDPTGLGACCQALHGNAKLGGPNQANYQSAAALCDGLRKSAQGRAALIQVRRALLNAKVPATCK